jgi:hypothetical protein
MEPRVTLVSKLSTLEKLTLWMEADLCQKIIRKCMIDPNSCR